MKTGGIKSRNILLVILWSYGLFILMHLYQYVGVLVAARMSGESFESIISGEFDSHKTELIIGLAAVIIGVPLVFLVTRFLWRRSFEWMRLRFEHKNLLFGLLLGFLFPLVIVSILRISGVAEITSSPHPLGSDESVALFIGYACMAVFAGIAEEIVFRGMAVREIAMRVGWIAAAVIGGAYFGAVHLVGNLSNLSLPGALWIILAGIAVSILFVALYVRSQSLWLPIGFHMSWNFCLKGIMGITMSGSESKIGLLGVELTGRDFLTGGSFGVEASIVSIAIYITAAILIFRFPWRGHVALLSNE
jgi:membrane protease YdiL (CAAX protease family)